MFETSNCPVCAAGETVPFLHRPSVPIHQHLLMSDYAAARALTRGCLTMVYCEACGFVYNARFEPALLCYGQDYDNSQTYSAAFNDYLDGLVYHLVEEKSVCGCRIVEVGCGKGLFLRKLVEYPGSHNVGIGFDPTYVGPTEDLDGRLHFKKTDYNEQAASVPADVVICRHVIEHVSEPLRLLSAVRLALKASPEARVFFETPCVEWILENGVIWDFFYEHCSLFSTRSLTIAFAIAGFCIEHLAKIFGGQYLWAEAVIRDGIPVQRDAGNVPKLATIFGELVEKREQEWVEMVMILQKQGGIALWGGGAKGVMFANLIDPDGQMLRCIVDVNPQKQGKFLPGTGHRIIAPMQLAAENVGTVLVLNPIYCHEIASFVKGQGWRINVVSLMPDTSMGM